MEYVSIPWENHWEGGEESQETWTINLALWFVHILAGNNYEARWAYGRLEDEKLVALTAIEDQADPEAVNAREGENRDSDQDEEEEENSDLSNRILMSRKRPCHFTPARERSARGTRKRRSMTFLSRSDSFCRYNF